MQNGIVLFQIKKAPEQLRGLRYIRFFSWNSYTRLLYKGLYAPCQPLLKINRVCFEDEAMPRSFSLHPFYASDAPPGVKISGSFFRQTDTLTFSCELSGPLDLIQIPAAANQPSRKDRLWEQTCFEVQSFNPETGKSLSGR